MFPYRTAFFVLLGVLIGALIAAGAFFGIRMHRVYNQLERTVEMHELVTTSVGAEEREQSGGIVAGDDIFGRFNTLGNEPDGIRMYDSRNFPTSSIVVEWEAPAAQLTSQEIAAIQRAGGVSSLGEGKQRDLVCDYAGSAESPDAFLDQADCLLVVYRAGTITAPEQLAGKPLYHVFRPGIGMGIYYAHAFALHNPEEQKFVLFADGENAGEWEMRQLNMNEWVSGSIPYSFVELRAPSQLEIPGQDSMLRFEKSLGVRGFITVSAEYNRGGLSNLFTGETYVPYRASESVFTDPVYGPVYFRDDSYHIILPDGSVQIYDLMPYFLQKQNIPEKEFYRAGHTADITWTKADISPNELFELSGEISTEGCAAGIVPCTNIVNDMHWFDENALVEIGRTRKGEPVYELSRRETNPYYRQLFDYGYAGAVISSYQEEDLEWDEAQKRLDEMTEAEQLQDFFADTPLFFWQDYRGMWRVYKKAKYTTLAECGKPVIYLYPEKEQDVRVQVAPNGGFTKTEPTYPDDGWFVRATPESALYNYADKSTYPYLFWEGIGYDYTQPKQGFVFSRDDVGEGVRTLLAQQGLIDNEVEDFMEFWEPRLTEKAYVFVSFLPQRTFDEMAPLTVDPKPETVIRVFMDYTPLDAPVSAEPLRFYTPARNGFTVVEWGGALRRS